MRLLGVPLTVTRHHKIPKITSYSAVLLNTSSHFKQSISPTLHQELRFELAVLNFSISLIGTMWRVNFLLTIVTMTLDSKPSCKPHQINVWSIWCKALAMQSQLQKSRKQCLQTAQIAQRMEKNMPDEKQTSPSHRSPVNTCLEAYDERPTQGP